LIRRLEVRPFSDKQIALLKTFADQAVIAIENVRLFKELQQRNRDLTEALEQQTATSEILRVISSSPTDVQPVMDTIAANAARLCDADDVHIHRVDGGLLRLAASFGSLPAFRDRAISRESIRGRAVLDRKTIHIPDVLAVAAEFSESGTQQRGARTILVTPLLREGVAIGVIGIRRMEIRPFSDTQIKLLETFADQAVIAIENVRLFKELQDRNRDLTEALEQQTATGEVLRVIASSPTELQPVLDTLLANAVKLSGATKGHIRQYDGEFFRYVSHFNESPEVIDALNQLPQRPRPESMSTQALTEKKTVQVLDAQAEPSFRAPAAQAQARTMMCVPLLREESGIGTITIWRDFVEPFTERQIELVKTFADQAVIAIENVRLFQELEARNRDLTEALEQQTATSEILRVISSSPTNLQPVFQTILDNAVRLCEAQNGAVFRFDGEVFRAVAWNNVSPALQAYIEKTAIRPGRESALRRVGLEKRPVQIPDMLADPDCVVPEPYKEEGMRTNVAVPLLKDTELIGAIAIHRREVRPFTDAHIKLVTTFADQAVIAIENVRLFHELTESLEQQTATSGILGVIASSPTDIQPVLDTIAASAARICGADDAVIRLVEGNFLRLRAHHGSIPSFSQVHGGESDSLDRGRDWIPGRAVLDRETIHIHDITAVESEFPETAGRARRAGVRTALATPLLREGAAIGVIFIRRTEVNPFTDKQITLLKTFADQAVIAIENVRLFKELQERNRDLTEALAQQTATSEILRVISSSPTDLKPVFETILANATRLCSTRNAGLFRFDGELLHFAAGHNLSPEMVTIQVNNPVAPGKETATRRAALERRTIHVPDVLASADFAAYETEQYSRAGRSSTLAVPLLKEDTLLGVIVTSHYDEVKPFTANQIKLVETFADQAVIAIENVRLFKELQERNAELRESLEQQTATSEILGVIASSPTDIQPVLETVATTAARLCEASDAQIRLSEGDGTRLVASFGTHPAPEYIANSQKTPGTQAFVERRPIHIHDLPAEVDKYPDSRELVNRTGSRTFLSVPMLREGQTIGLINIRRTVVRPFSERQIQLLETFAAQAVIAIENVRLFKELQERNAELHEALEHQTATSEVLGIISRSPTDVQPVLDAIVESAARVCGIDDVVLRLNDSGMAVVRAHFGSVPVTAGREAISISELHHQWIREHGTLHIPDVHTQRDVFPTLAASPGARSRTFLIVPLRRQGGVIGTLNARRTEVHPFIPAQIKLLETFADQAVIALENVRLFNDLKESLEQQTATSEILGIIASSPTDIQPVLDAVAASAARLCDSYDAQIFRLGTHTIDRVASHGPLLPASEHTPLNRQSPAARAIIDRQTLHIDDLAAEIDTEYPEIKAYQQRIGHRTTLATPLLREGVPIGAILIRRLEVRPFSDKQIALLDTFADQAVIAIENVRLFKELQERNTELREALEYQTATAEVLGIISRSPTDVQPVLDAIVESAARVCGIDDVLLRLHVGNTMVARAHYGPIPIGRIEIGIDEPEFRWMREHGTLHIPDIREHKDFPMVATSSWRTFLSAPLHQQGELVGVLTARRIEVRAFTPAQIKLLETFADQAVIAIENVRLFNELKESLEQQTATSRILGVIASSPTEIQPVMDTIVENAAKVCGASDAVLRLVEGNVLRTAAHYGPVPDVAPERPLDRRSPGGRAVVERQIIHLEDALSLPETEFPETHPSDERMSIRTVLAVPLMREDVPIGSIHIRRTEVRPFTGKQIALLKTFADQAVIAIENVRLFKELQERNRDLTEALEQQTVTSEVLRVIASSPVHLQPVYETILQNVARLCDANIAVLFVYDRDVLKTVAHHGTTPAFAELLEGRDRAPGRETPSRLCALERRIVHVSDLLSDPSFSPTPLEIYQRENMRTSLAVPMLREDTLVGVINAWRREVRPFTDKQVALVQTFADQAVIAIENVRLFQELQARTQELARSVGELRALGEVGQAVSSTLDLQTVLSTIVGRAVQLSGTDCGIIYEYDEPTREFQLRASYQMEEELVKAYQATPLRLGEGATGRAAETRTPTQIDDLREEQEFATRGMRPILSRLGYRSLLAVPLLLDQRIMGALTIYRRQTGTFAPEVVNLLQTFATQSVLAIQNARLFREIEDKGRQLEAANRHKSEFLANVSHELRTPLNAIIGFSEVLGERMFGELNEKQAEYTEDILSSGRHLLSLINDILDLSKIEAGRMELEVTTFHLPDAIENALTLIRERASRHGIKLDRAIDDQLGDFTGDERKVKQVLVNLLSNAVKFTPEGGQIKVEASLGDSAVIVSVSDTGIGIAKEDQEAIFEEFRQVGSNYAHKREGTGLGLALTRKFVELHRGKIWVESEVGRGSKFTFTLPTTVRGEG
jgi:GAF domain-containing protein/anti-sigma regulatory factor (Ser/Thr protein kinase)